MKRFIKTSLATVTALAASTALGAGFEKANWWNAKHSALGGNAVSSVKGADSLYFNPAGLGNKKEVGHEISGNISPVWSSFEGPNGTGGQLKSKDHVAFPFGLNYEYKVAENFAFGVGGHTVAGTYAEFEENQTKTELAINEIVIGGSFMIMEGLSIGAGWRMSFVEATLDTLGPNSFEDLSDTQYEGYRVGAQYNQESWGAGIQYRSAVEFDAKGDLQNNGVTVGEGSIQGTLPQQIQVGGHLKMGEAFTGFLQWDWTEYSMLSRLPLVTPLGTNNIPLRWKDQQVYRVGLEYGLEDAMPVRVGYALTSAVVPEGYAQPSFTTPGWSHSISAGTGIEAAEGFMIDGAVEFGWADGEVAPEDVEGPFTAPGEYRTRAIPTLHLSASYMF